MHDLSEFMKTLKQRFSIWYNRNHDKRLGTLWTERFKSVLVEGSEKNVVNSRFPWFCAAGFGILRKGQF